MDYRNRHVLGIDVWLGWMLVLLVTAGFSGTGIAADFTTEQWRVVEIPLTSSVSYADPFNAVEVTATFTGPGGQVMVRPAFWDGTNTWRIRFAPPLVGQWTMITSCTAPANSGLQGVTRTLQCNAYAGTNVIYQHGFLKVSPNGRYFVHADGTPFFYLGDTHWLFIHERFETSNVPGVPSEFKYTVDKRVAQGFTVFQSEAIHIPHGGIHTNATEEPHADLTDGLTAADLPGFRNIDQKFAYLADHGLVHANAFITWAAEPGANAIYTQAYMTKLGRYWAARYGAFPVLWTTAQEIDPNLYGGYDATSMGLWYAGAQAVFTNDAYGQPLGAHMQSNGNGMNSPADSSWDSKPCHKWWPMQLQGDMSGFAFEKSFWQHAPTKPIVLYESAYESFWTDTKGARGAGYKAFQWGMCGYGYGANGTWNDLYSSTDYNGTGDYGTSYFMPGSYLNWFDGANLPGAVQMTYLKNFYTALNWWQLTPRFDDPAWSGFVDPNHSFLSSDSNLTYVVYFFGDGNSTGVLKGMASGISYEASWFDPRTGISTSLGGITPTAGQWPAPARPSSNDWILLVQQNPAAIVPAPANGAVVSQSLTCVSWTGSGSNLYEVFFGNATSYDPEQPHGHLIRISPSGGLTNPLVALPRPLELGTTYEWLLVVVNPALGTTNLYAWSFTVATGSIPIANPSFETPLPGGVGGGWAQIGAPWVVQGNSAYQQNNLTPNSAAHFSGTSPGGGAWYALLNGNTDSIIQDLLTTVNVGDTLSMSFYGGRAKASSLTAGGGVFTATFLVGLTPYSMAIDTTALANNTWQSYTLTRAVTNSGNLRIQFNSVTGDPWLDNISNVALTPAPLLSVTLTNPADGQGFLTGSSIIAQAAIANGTGPCTVTYYTNAVGGMPAVAGVASTAPYAVSVGAVTPGTYEISATVVDSAVPAAMATSFTHTFTIASAITIPVSNGSFEIPGALSGAEGWAHIAAGWNPANGPSGQFQQNNLSPIGNAHFTSACLDGGDWYALMNDNTVSISQDLNAHVNVGDRILVTFYGGRGREVSSTSAGGVFAAAFLVGSARYGVQVDTTALPNGSWQKFTLSQIATNSGNLSLQFSAVSGDPWLDNLSNVSLTPALPVPPKFTGISVSGTTLTLTATGGTPNGPWTLLQSTNVALPLSQWTTNISGRYDGNGNLLTTLVNTATNAREFYMLK